MIKNFKPFTKQVKQPALPTKVDTKVITLDEELFNRGREYLEQGNKLEEELRIKREDYVANGPRGSRDNFDEVERIFIKRLKVNGDLLETLIYKMACAAKYNGTGHIFRDEVAEALENNKREFEVEVRTYGK